MNFASTSVVLVIALLVFLAVRHVVKKGACAQCGKTEGCGGCSGCESSYRR